MSTWKNETFTEIMRTQGMRQAFEYRRDTLGDPIPYEHLTDEEKLALDTPTAEPQGDVVVATTIPAETTQNEPSVTTESETKIEEESKYSIAEVKVKLKEAGISFAPRLGDAKVIELAIANNLI